MITYKKNFKLAKFHAKDIIFIRNQSCVKMNIRFLCKLQVNFM